MSTQPESSSPAPEWDTADRMRKALRHSGIGVEEMATYLDVTRRSVGNWINGHVPPSRQTLRLWALRTGVSYEWLCAGVSPEWRCHGDNRPCFRDRNDDVSAGQSGGITGRYFTRAPSATAPPQFLRVAA